MTITGGDESLQFECVGGHRQAIEALVEKLPSFGVGFAEIAVVGHRVVHGGEQFSQSVIINKKTLQGINACSPLAPLHNPSNILGIELLQTLFPRLPQVAVFDTAFHQSLPKHVYLYAIPYELYEQYGVRRYGFHGTSHRYVSEQAIQHLGLATTDNQLIIAHLGNGCSATAIVNGRSVDTSMGLTPLEGLVMGTRSGNVDPSLHQFLQDKLGWSLQRITAVLNCESGLLGLSKMSNDMRSLRAAADEGSEAAILAIDVFCFRLARQLAALAASLQRIDALVFTGGIGENSAPVRQRVMEQLAILGFIPDSERNLAHGGQSGMISAEGSTRAMVLATNEELMIARDALKLCCDAGGGV